MEYRITEAMGAEFRNYLIEQERSWKTIEKYERDLRRFIKYMNGREVSKQQVIRYKNYLLGRYAASSVNSMLAPVNLFLREQGWSACMVRLVKVQKDLFRDRCTELGKEEYYQLLAAARKTNLRLYYIMETLGATGIRISELKYITAESLENQCAVVRSKGKQRTVMLPKELCRHLKDYAEMRQQESGSIFVTRNGKPVDRSNIYHEMKRLCETAGIGSQKVFPHNFRHLFAAAFYEENHDLTYLADMLGHSSVETTRTYTQISCARQEARMEGLGLAVSPEEAERLAGVNSFGETNVYLGIYIRYIDFSVRTI